MCLSARCSIEGRTSRKCSRVAETRRFSSPAATSLTEELFLRGARSIRPTSTIFLSASTSIEGRTSRKCSSEAETRRFSRPAATSLTDAPFLSGARSTRPTSTICLSASASMEGRTSRKCSRVAESRFFSRPAAISLTEDRPLLRPRSIGGGTSVGAWEGG